MCYLLRFPLQGGDLLAELYMFYIVSEVMTITNPPNFTVD